MAEELGLDDRNTETEELELFKHHEIQNEAGEIKPATFSFSQPGFSYQSPYGTSFTTPEKEDSNFSSVNSSMNSLSYFTLPQLNSTIKPLDKTCHLGS